MQRYEIAVKPPTGTDPLTGPNVHEIKAGGRQCRNPFCKTPTTGKTGKRCCSAHCRMDVYALRRAREIKNRVGVVRFFELMELA